MATEASSTAYSAGAVFCYIRYRLRSDPSGTAPLRNVMFMFYDANPNFVLFVLLSISLLSAIPLLWRAARRTTVLRGPSDASWLSSVTKRLSESQEPGRLYDQWVEECGSVFGTPCGLGRSCVVLCDPKAIQHFYARETRAYVHTSLLRVFTERAVSEMFQLL